MATRLTGIVAIEFAKRNGTTLSVLATASDPARDDVSVDEAQHIADTTPERVYVDSDGPPDDDGE
jgi:hypothetical protein